MAAVLAFFGRQYVAIGGDLESALTRSSKWTGMVSGLDEVRQGARPPCRGPSGEELAVAFFASAGNEETLYSRYTPTRKESQDAKAPQE